MSAAESLATQAALQPLLTNAPTGLRIAVGTSIVMNFSAVDCTPCGGTDKSPSNEIEPGQSLQSFLTNNAIASSFKCDLDKVSVVPLPPLQEQERSPESEFYQLNLLRPLKPQEPPLRIEAVSANVTVGNSERFCLIHQESGLRIPGQFSYYEAQEILELTAGWDWGISYRPRTPYCSYNLLNLLKTVCTPRTQEVAA